MNKLKLSVGILLVGCMAFATNFAACGSKSSGTGTGGTGGTAAGGSTGAAGADPAATLPNGNCVPGAFKRPTVCACQMDIPTVCEAMCTDTTTDVANCGKCGTACNATAACNASKCGADVTNVVPAVTGCMALNIALAGTTIYFTDQGHGTVNSVATTGGAVTKLAMTEKSPGMILVSGTNLYWISVVSQTPVTIVDGGIVDGGVDGGVSSTLTTASIRKMMLPTGAPADLVTETNTHGGILGITLNAAGDTIYYSADTNVKSIAVSGTATTGTVVAEEQLGGIPAAIGIDGTTLAYLTMQNGDVDVVTVGASAASKNGNMCPANTACCGTHDPGDPNMENLLNTNCTRVARSQGAPFFGGMIIKGGNLYWSNDGAIQSNSAAQVTNMGGFDTNNAQVATTGGAPVTAMAGDATNIYFAYDGFVLKTPYTTMSTAVNIARAQMAPSSIALDATKVYWSTGDCAINSIPK